MEAVSKRGKEHSTCREGAHVQNLNIGPTSETRWTYWEIRELKESKPMTVCGLQVLPHCTNCCLVSVKRNDALLRPSTSISADK